MDDIRRILSEYGGLGVDADTVADDDDLYARGLTSHATVSVMLACEDAFGLEFPSAVVRRSTFASVANLRAVLADLGADVGTADSPGRATQPAE